MFEISDFYQYCKSHQVDVIPYDGCPQPGATIRDEGYYAVFWTSHRSARPGSCGVCVFTNWDTSQPARFTRWTVLMNWWNGANTALLAGRPKTISPRRLFAPPSKRVTPSFGSYRNILIFRKLVSPPRLPIGKSASKSTFKLLFFPKSG